MISRYASATGAGALVTAALILLMQDLIATGGFTVEPHESLGFRFAAAPPLPKVPPIRPPPPEPPPPATIPPKLPGLVDTAIESAGAPEAPAAHATLAGLPALDGPHIGVPGGFGTLISTGDPQPVSRVSPVYPYAAERRGLEGSVVVEFTIKADGSVSNAHVVRSTHLLFERAALDAVARYRYQPRTIDGIPLAVSGIKTEFLFELEN